MTSLEDESRQALARPLPYMVTHHSVLKLGSLTQKISQLLAVLHNDGRLFRNRKKLSGVVYAGQR